MEGAKVKVKWDKKWYPATIFRRINEREVEVEFDDPEFLPEIVSITDTKAINDVGSSLPIKAVAGAFDWQVFKAFFLDKMGDDDFVTPLSVQELAELDLKSSLFSAHARERVEERYRENMQELLRSFNTDQYLAFRETRRRVICGCLRIDFTPDMNHIHSLQIEKSTKAIERPYLQLVNIGHLRDEVETWLLRHAPDVSLDFESCKLVGDVFTTQVITTTTRFVLSKDCSCVVTVIKLGQSFGEWRQYYDRAQKRKEQKRHNKRGIPF